MIKAASKTNPKLATLVSQLDVSKFKFYATDVAQTGGVYSNVNVVLAGPAQGMTAADLKEQLGPLLKSAGGTLLDVKRVKVGDKSAFRDDSTLPFKHADGTITEEGQGQLIIPGASSTAVISVTSSDDAAGAALIDTMLAGVRHI